MAEIRSKRDCRKKEKKKKKKKLKKKFLLTAKKCWLIDEKLIPMCQHLVDSYSVLLREELTLRVEETDLKTTRQVKEEPQDDYLVDSQQLQLSSRTNQLEVIISHYDELISAGWLLKNI